MATYNEIRGTITDITDIILDPRTPPGCNKLITLEEDGGSIVNFVVTPLTYFVNNLPVNIGDYVVGFYDITLPVPLIYPPQYQAVVMAKVFRNQNIKVDTFNRDLISSDGLLQINIGPITQLLLTNGQYYTGHLPQHTLIVVYGQSTRSIPAQTTPDKIIVMCR